MKLLYVLPEYSQGGGIGAFYRQLLPRLVAAGHEVRVIVGSGVHAHADAAPQSMDGLSVEQLKLSLLRKHEQFFGRYCAFPTLRRHLAAAWAIREQAEQGAGFDVVETVDWGMLFAPWATEGTIPTVVQLHGSCGQVDLHDPIRGAETEGTLTRLLERSALGRNVQLQAYSHLNAKDWVAQGLGPVNIIEPAVALPAPAAAQGTRSAAGLVVGRVQKWKGAVELCEAIQLLGSAAPPIDWIGRDTAFGKPGMTTAGYLQARYPGIWGRSIRHRAAVPPSEVRDLQAAAAFCLVPSQWDTFNFTCVEAMGTAAPVICSSGAGASELIEDGHNGLLYEAGSAQALANAVRRMLELSPQQRRAMGECARETVAQRLDPATIVKRRIHAYERCRAEHTSAARLPEENWVAQALRPDTNAEQNFDFLHQVPLRELTAHTATRMIRKVTAGRA